MEYNIGNAKNKLIVVEGACDGIGKSTQVKLLREHLEQDGNEIVSHHFPSYGTPQGALVEKQLKGELGELRTSSPYFISSLYAIDRAITWNSILKPQYEEGKTILLDRYTTSNLIYQGVLFDDIEKRKEFIKYILDYEYDKLGIQEPDKIIFLHAPFDLVTEMRRARKENEGIANDIYERDLEFMKKSYDNAMFLADYLNWEQIKCDEGDHLRSIEDIHEDVYKRVRK